MRAVVLESNMAGLEEFGETWFRPFSRRFTLTWTYLESKLIHHTACIRRLIRQQQIKSHGATSCHQETPNAIHPDE
jgi:hypothetical protein